MYGDWVRWELFNVVVGNYEDSLELDIHLVFALLQSLVVLFQGQPDALENEKPINYGLMDGTDLLVFFVVL